MLKRSEASAGEEQMEAVKEAGWLVNRQEEEQQAGREVCRKICRYLGMEVR